MVVEMSVPLLNPDMQRAEWAAETLGVHPEKRGSDRVEANLANSLFCQVASGLTRSKFIRATVVSVSAAVASLFLLTNPVGWLVTAIGVGAFAVSMLAQLPTKRGRQMASFELFNLWKLISQRKSLDYNEIFETRNGIKIYLGAVPNRLGSHGKRLRDEKGVGAVLSVYEPKHEAIPRGLYVPYLTNDWKALNVNHHTVDVRDHQLLSLNQLDRAADFIARQIEARKNVAVHCRAGKGRSAMAVAAYLIKYQGQDVSDAINTILQGRSKSTIRKKEGQLLNFFNTMNEEDRKEKDQHQRHLTFPTNSVRKYY